MPERVFPVAAVAELDFDPALLRRFPPEELMEGRVTLLHQTEAFPRRQWRVPERSDLWNFNLHYFEFLLPLAEAGLRTGDRAYLQKALALMDAWTAWNPPARGGPGWSPYTISLRLTHVLAFYTWTEALLTEEERARIIRSIYRQYAYLARHLERHLLGNHYFENLKALVLCGLFFRDRRLLGRALRALEDQCREQILPDGVHFERSPMYQKLVLEGLIRVAVALRAAETPSAVVEQAARRAMDAAYSLESGLTRLPLFHDCGENVAKSLDALTGAASAHLRLTPRRQLQLPQGGYYILDAGPWRLVAFAGPPGPDHLPCHTHCDGMSFELFCRGRPVLVNCGTYAYQDPQRDFFRSTAAHNTVMADGVEQAHLWGVFRVAERYRVRVLEAGKDLLRMELTDQAGTAIERTIRLSAGRLLVRDRARGHTLRSFFHGLRLDRWEKTVTARQMRYGAQPYAPEFGRQERIEVLELSGRDLVSVEFSLTEQEAERGSHGAL